MSMRKQSPHGLRDVPTLTCVEEISGKEALAKYFNWHRQDVQRLVRRARVHKVRCLGLQRPPPGFPMEP